MPTTASAPSRAARLDISSMACVRDLTNSSSYDPLRPPTMFRMLALKSRIKFTPETTSPNTTPLYSKMVRPSMVGVVVRIMAFDLCVLSKVIIKGELSKRGGRAPSRASVFPEPPGAKTASHALKRGRPHFANLGLPRFRAQKPDFASDGSVREYEFEYNCWILLADDGQVFLHVLGHRSDHISQGND